MTVTIPRWLLVVLGALVGAAIAVGVTLYVTEDDPDETTTETTPEVSAEAATSPEELAQIEAAANEWEAVFNATTGRAKRCEQRERVGLETYDECAAREVGPPNDEAGAELAQAWAALEPVVASECAEALDRVAQKIGNLGFATADEALPPCQASVSP